MALALLPLRPQHAMRARCCCPFLTCVLFCTWCSLGVTDAVGNVTSPRPAKTAPDAVPRESSSPTPWGLDRIDQTHLPLDGAAFLPSTFTRRSFSSVSEYDNGTRCPGRGVHVYVVDTGIDATHAEFAGRVGAGYDAYDGGGGPPDDCQGHGTNVAGVAVGQMLGVARCATVHAVKVFNCDGWGMTDHVLRGLEWVRTQVSKPEMRPAVVVMSIGGGFSHAINDAVDRVHEEGGAAVVVSAGNQGTDSCRYSPAASTRSIAVGAVDETDTRPAFSNYGSCTDMFAPGLNILGPAWAGAAKKLHTNTAHMGSEDDAGSRCGNGGVAHHLEGDERTGAGELAVAHEGGNGCGETALEHATRLGHGTSMAAPFVAGAAAVFLSHAPHAAPHDVYTALVAGATRDKVKDIGDGSPNLLLNVRGLLAQAKECRRNHEAAASISTSAARNMNCTFSAWSAWSPPSCPSPEANCIGAKIWRNRSLVRAPLCASHICKLHMADTEEVVCPCGIATPSPPPPKPPRQRVPSSRSAVMQLLSMFMTDGGRNHRVTAFGGSGSTHNPTAVAEHPHQVSEGTF